MKVLGITAHEYWEYQKRKATAQAEYFVGILMAIGGFGCLLGMFITGNGWLLWGFLFLVALGAIFLWEADEKLKKIQHIYWTKQALREYEESKYKILEGVEKEAHPSVSEESTRLGDLAKFFGLETREKRMPMEVEKLPEDNLTSERERISRLLEKLDERLVNGEISEDMYKELKSKYLTKLNEVEEEIKARERAREEEDKLYKQTDFSKLRELLIAYANEKYWRKLLPEREKFIYFVSETLKLPVDERNITDRNLLKCAQILNIEIPRRTAKSN